MMTSWATTPGIERSMRSNRPRDTLPEVRLRSALHRSGLRFRKHVRPVHGLRCEADIAFSRAQLAVFLDGCWWHSCPEHGEIPKQHKEFWSAKLAGTRERDRRNTDALVAAGWSVLRIWEHESLEDAVRKVHERLGELAEGTPRASRPSNETSARV